MSALWLEITQIVHLRIITRTADCCELGNDLWFQYVGVGQPPFLAYQLQAC